MKKIFVLAGIFILAIMSGIFVINISEADTQVTQKATKVGVILNGEKQDGSWSHSHYEGLEKTANQLNLAITYKENVVVDEVEKLIDEFVEDGCEIVIANSFEFGEYMKTGVEKYPEVYFYHATGVEEGKNFSSYFGRMYQIRYLCGIVAGLQTKTNEIGYVAAFPISEVNRGINAFTLGVRKVNPNANVYVDWTNSWVDDTAAEAATNRLLDKHNIDLIAMHTDSLMPLEIAEERNVFSIGYNVDNSKTYSKTFLTAAVWDWEKFYTPEILRCIQGKFEGGHHWESIETGIVSLAPLTELVEEGVAEKVQQEYERLCEGNYDVFYGPVKDQDGMLRVAEGESMTDKFMLNEFDWYVEGVVIDEE